MDYNKFNNKLVDFDAIPKRRNARFYDPDRHVTASELADLFGDDVDELRAMCMRHYLMCFSFIESPACYHSPLLSPYVLREARRDGESLVDAYRRLRNEFPMANAKENFARNAWKAEKRRLQDAISTIAKRHGVRVKPYSNTPDEYEIQAFQDGAWNRVGRIVCM